MIGRWRSAGVFVLAATSLATAAWADVIHVVRRGETLASISTQYYGDASREALLVAANVLHVQADISIVPGMHVVVPTSSFLRVQAGETWQVLAERELGSPARAQFLSRMNQSPLGVLPSPGAVLRIPYLLRYVVPSDDEPLHELAQRFYGDRTRVQFILEFNRLSSGRLRRGQVIIVPVPDLSLRDPSLEPGNAALAQASAAQQDLEAQIPTLQGFVRQGQFVEALVLGARLSASTERSNAERIAIALAMAESACALDRGDLAAEHLREVLRANPAFTLDPRLASPKLMTALALARGVDPGHPPDPAPSTARPDEAH